jgi:hypothetical protein
MKPPMKLTVELCNLQNKVTNFFQICLQNRGKESNEHTFTIMTGNNYILQ